MNSLKLKRLLALMYTPFSKGLTGRKQILIYHSIGDDGNAVSQKAFAEQMEWLSRHVRLVNLRTLLEDRSAESMVAITFDDGYISVFEQALPILKRFNAAATVYINTAWIGEQEPKASDPAEGHYPNEKFMHWEQVKELYQQGWNIGSHGHHHFDLTTIDNDKALNELKESMHLIQEKLQLTAIDFSYTWGHHNSYLQNQVQQMGYVSAVAGHHGPVIASSNPFALPRIDIRREYTLGDFAGIMRGRWDFLGPLQRVRNA